MIKRAPRNRTLTCEKDELQELQVGLLVPSQNLSLDDLYDTVINADFFEAVKYLPSTCIDLLIMDPPYNLSKNYNGNTFNSMNEDVYKVWFTDVVDAIIPALKKDASIYVCSDWQSSNMIYPVLRDRFTVQNRITWEREKGRGAKRNWKNNTEDIWFCTVGNEYHFDVDAVKLKRKVIAPYRMENGAPKDWEEEAEGNYRLTHPSNVWTDITIPFWSMPENTDHPTQKPEKLIAKLILASSQEGDFVFDPFLGSGTSAVVAKKLMRRFSGIEINTEYCCWAQKRLALANMDRSIQGYADGVFWERNSLNEQPKSIAAIDTQSELF